MKLRNRIIRALFFITVIGVQSVFAAELGDIQQRTNFLNHIRNHDPYVYRDFILRFSPFEFLEKMETALVASEGARSRYQLVDFTVYTAKQETDDKPKLVGVDEIQKNLNLFLEANKYNQQSVGTFFEQHLVAISKLNSFNSTIYRIKKESAAAILALEPNERIKHLSSLIKDLPKIDGFNPRLVGFDKDSFSGAEFIEHYSKALAAEKNISALFPIILSVKDQGGLNESVGSLCQRLMSSKRNLFTGFLSVADVQSKVNSFSFKLNFDPSKFIKKYVNDFYNVSSVINAANEGSKSETKAVSLAFEQADPLESLLRGCKAGDCATRNSPAQTMLPGELTFWITVPGVSSDNYVQMSVVNVGPNKALYVHTISGNRLSREKTKEILDSVYLMKEKLGANLMVLPPEDRLRSLINYAEARAAFENVVKDGRKVSISYDNEQLRREMSKFAENDLDIPERNREAVVYEPSSKEIKNLDIEINNSARISIGQYENTNRLDALMIAIEIGSYGKKIDSHFFEAYKLDKGEFNSVLEALKNNEGDTVERFQRKARSVIQNAGIKIDLEDLLKSHIMFRGHMKCPDALEGKNANIALSYIEPLLSAHDKSNYIYQLLMPHMANLSKNQTFHRIVKELFRDNFASLNKPRSHLEMTTKSSRRTLINLFEVGLGQEVYALEIQKIKEEAATNKGNGEMEIGAFIRAVTFVGSILKFDNQYSENLLKHFESFANQKVVVNYEDLKVAASYFAAVLERGKLTDSQIKRLNRLGITTKLGLDLVFQTLRIEQKSLDEAGVIDKLLEQRRFKDASTLLYSGRNAAHGSSSRWLKVLSENRDSLDFDQLYRMFANSPDWLKVAGSDHVVSLLKIDAKKTTLTDRLFATIQAHQQALSSNVKTNSCYKFYKGQL